MFREWNRITRWKRREPIIFLSCFLFTAILYLIGTLQLGSPAMELISQLHVVLLVSLIIYGAVALLRIIYYLISRLWVRK
jgi:CDP-diglyceride synthetase